MPLLMPNPELLVIVQFPDGLRKWPAYMDCTTGQPTPEPSNQWRFYALIGGQWLATEDTDALHNR